MTVKERTDKLGGFAHGFLRSDDAQDQLRRAAKNIRQASGRVATRRRQAPLDKRIYVQFGEAADSIKKAIRSARRAQPERERWRRFGVFGAIFGTLAGAVVLARKRFAESTNGDAADNEMSSPVTPAADPAAASDLPVS